MATTITEPRDPGRNGPGTPLRVFVEAALQAGCKTSREIAEYIFEEHGLGLFFQLPRREVISMIAEASRGVVGNAARRTVHVEHFTTDKEGRTESLMRIAPNGKGTYWANRYLCEGGVMKLTTELTRRDLRYLIDDQHRQADEDLMKAEWFQACLDLMLEHGCKKLGELREMGIELPTIVRSREEL